MYSGALSMLTGLTAVTIDIPYFLYTHALQGHSQPTGELLVAIRKCLVTNKEACTLIQSSSGGSNATESSAHSAYSGTTRTRDKFYTAQYLLSHLEDCL